MKKLLKVLGILVLLIVVLVGATAIYVNASYDKKFPETPYPNIKATTDSATIAWGKYLVYGPAHCATCHTADGQQNDVDMGKELPLIGGWELSIPPGTFRSRNLTSDKETGIGSRTDGEIARTMRYHVNSKGQVILPLMPFEQMSDYDMTAIISYLRTMPAVKHEVKPSEYSFLGKVVKTFIFKPFVPTEAPVAKIQRDTTVAYGKYLAHYVANCYGCHTDRDLKTGEFTGKPFAGGFQMPPDNNSKGYGFVTPNLTPDEETGRLIGWTEEAFVNRFRAGRTLAVSPMPWGPFSRMDDVELKAIYRYLQTVTPVKNEVKKTAYAAGETLPPIRNWKE